MRLDRYRLLEAISGDISNWEINGGIDCMFLSSKSKNIKLDPNKIQAYN